MFFYILFIRFCMNFIHAIETDAYILPRIDKLNKLFYRAVKLSDNILNCQHHTERHISLYNGRGSKNSNKDVLDLIDSNASSLLGLLKIQ